jgi:hypothetical protein
MSHVNLPKDLLNLVNGYLAKYDKKQHKIIMRDIRKWLGFRKEIDNLTGRIVATRIEFFNITLMSQDEPLKYKSIIMKHKKDFNITTCHDPGLTRYDDVPDNQIELISYQFGIGYLKRDLILEGIFGWDLLL